MVFFNPRLGVAGIHEGERFAGDGCLLDNGLSDGTNLHVGSIREAGTLIQPCGERGDVWVHPVLGGQCGHPRVVVVGDAGQRVNIGTQPLFGLRGP